MIDAELNDAILFDARWTGNFGIGRYTSALQELAKFAHQILPAAAGIEPGSLRDPVFLANEIKRKGEKLYFTPGFNASARATQRQVLILHDLTQLKLNPKRWTPKRVYMERVVRPAIVKNQVAITDSAFSRREVSEWTGLSEEKVIVCGGGLQALFAQAPAPTRLGNRGPVLFVGNNKRHKRFNYLVDAMQFIQRDLVVVGINERDPLADRARSILPGRVQMVTDLDEPDLLGLYRAAAVLAFPSHYEGFGLPALEAMSQALPVVYTADAVGEILGPHGRFVAADAPAQRFAEAIEETWTHVERGGSAGRTRAMNFSWSSVVQRIVDTLKKHAG